MRIGRIGTRYLVRGEVGDRLPDVLTQLAIDHDWKSGSLSGIGGVRDVELAYFDLAQKRYFPIKVDGVVELVSLSGNLALVESRPFWHLHAVVSDRNGVVTAGHLSSLTVAVTVECWLDVDSAPVTRSPDPGTGLNLLGL